jgi:hypothetical protein
MSKKIHLGSLTFEQEDLDIIDQHSKELANCGRSVAMRHIIRQWAEMHRNNSAENKLITESTQKTDNDE